MFMLSVRVRLYSFLFCSIVCYWQVFKWGEYSEPQYTFDWKADMWKSIVKGACAEAARSGAQKSVTIQHTPSLKALATKDF